MTRLHRHNLEAILFDLDGTLLEVEMRDYIDHYAAALAACLGDRIAPERTVDAIFAAIRALIRRSDGTSSNADFFNRHIADQLGLEPRQVAASFAGFIDGDLSRLDPLMQPLPLAAELVAAALARSLTVVIATNPVFPRTVVAARLQRAGLADFPFRLVTSYENSRRCKPNPDYFSDILEDLALRADNCLMVGNDTGHDLAARAIGIPTFLVDTWLIDRCRGDFETELRGDHAALLDFITNLDKPR